MTEQKETAVIELIKIINALDMSSIAILTSGANMLKAKEVIDARQSIEAGLAQCAG